VTFLILFVATAVIFLALDALMLTLVMRPLFERHIADMLLADIRFVPALLFYLGYVAGLIWLVSLPALRDGDPLRAALQGAVVGAMAYGTYEFTSYAILKGWHPSMVAADLAWGTALTAVAAWGGVMVARALA
jgi:uncharacterized membrane protein